jgi:hypothetical protein
MPKLTPEEAAEYKQQQSAAKPAPRVRERRYLVKLKSGKWSVFTDAHDRSDFKALLVSGRYSIGDTRDGKPITTTETITPNNVVSIDELTDDAVLDETLVSPKEDAVVRVRNLRERWQ